MLYTAHISWEEEKKPHDLNLLTATPYVTETMRILQRTQPNIINGKLNVKDNQLWISWSYNRIPTRRKNVS